MATCGLVSLLALISESRASQLSCCPLPDPSFLPLYYVDCFIRFVLEPRCGNVGRDARQSAVFRAERSDMAEPNKLRNFEGKCKAWEAEDLVYFDPDIIA